MCISRFGNAFHAKTDRKDATTHLFSVSFISLDAEGGLLTRAASHEQTHFLRYYNAKGYERLKEKVIALIKKRGIYDTLKEKIASNGYKEDAIEEEMVCDALFSVYDRKFIKELAKNDPKVAEILGDTLDNYVDACEASLRMFAEGNELTKELLEEVDFLKEINEIFKEELAVATQKWMESEKSGKAGEENKFSSKEDIDYLHKMSYNQYRTEKLSFEHSSLSFGTQKMLYNPKDKNFEVWEKGDDGIVILGTAKAGEAAEELYEQTYGNAINEIRRNYEGIKGSEGESDWDNALPEDGEYAGGNSRYSVGKRIQSDSRGSGTNLLENNNKESINEPSSEDGGFYMPKFSTKDSDGNVLSEKQIEYFKNSKVRDENGNLLKVYHGTPEGGFTEFDSRKSLIADKPSVANWFSANLEMINKYYNVENSNSLNGRRLYSGYLNMENPLIIDAHNDGWNQIKVSDEIRDGINYRYRNYLTDEMVLSDRVTTEQIAEYARKNNYDGVIINNVRDGSVNEEPSTVYAVFESHQFKNSDNTNPTSDSDIRFSFKGENSALTERDKSNLSIAKEMSDRGDDSEKIRLATGWFKGYDGRWRFEISDFESKLIDNPKIEEHENDGEYYFTAKLSDVLEHKELFEAYPELKDYLVIIQNTEPGTMGITFAKDKQIVLNKELFSKTVVENTDYLKYKQEEISRIEQSPEYHEWQKYYEDEYQEKYSAEEWLILEKNAMNEFFNSDLGKRYYQLVWGKDSKIQKKTVNGWSDAARSVLLHEIQHTVQAIEGFSGGSSPEWWSNKIRNTLYNEMKTAREKLLDLISNNSDYKEILYWYDERVERISKDDSNRFRYFADAYDTAEKEFNENDEEIIDAFWDYSEALEAYKTFDKIKGDVYYNRTAGEIESRDVESRINLSPEQRKNTRPNIDRTDVVFADGGESYSIGYTSENQAVLVVNDNIISNATNEKELISIVKKSLGRFKRVPIQGQNIYFISDTKKEYVNSRYSQWLKKNDSKTFKDKMRLAAHPQDIVYATTEYINEGLKHPRKDNIIDFARGKILVDVSGRQYSAEVVIGFTKSGICELHDIVKMKATNFEYKKEATSESMDSKKESARSDVTSNNSIYNSAEKVNKFSTKSIPSDIEAYYNNKIAENRELIMILNNLGEDYKNLSGKVVLDDVQMRRMVIDMVNKYNSKISKLDFNNKLRIVYDYMANTPVNLWNGDEIIKYLVTISKEMLEESETVDDSLYDSEFRKWMRKYAKSKQLTAKTTASI